MANSLSEGQRSALRLNNYLVSLSLNNNTNEYANLTNPEKYGTIVL